MGDEELSFGKWISSDGKFKILIIEKDNFFIDGKPFRRSFNQIMSGYYVINDPYYVRNIKADTIILGLNESGELPYDSDNLNDKEIKFIRMKLKN